LPDPTDPLVDHQTVQLIRNALRTYGHLSKAAGKDPEALRSDLASACVLLGDPTAIDDPRLQSLQAELISIGGFEDVAVLDPFAGSGAIPVEAQRLGCQSLAGEYSPVASSYARVMMEWSRTLDESALETLEASLQAKLSVAHEIVQSLYPVHPVHGRPVGYIRFRRLVCEGPECGALVPATSKFILDADHQVGLVYTRRPQKGQELLLKLASGPPDGFPAPTVRGGGLLCPACGFTTKRAAVVKQRARYRLEPTIVAVVYRTENSQVIESPTTEQADVDYLADLLLSRPELAAQVPRELWPKTELRRFSPPLYGYASFADCHTPRQLALLAALTSSLTVDSQIRPEAFTDFAALVVVRAVEQHTAFCRWRSDRGGDNVETFAGKSIGMMWDFFEADPFHESNELASYVGALLRQTRAAKHRLTGDGTVFHSAVQDLPIPDESVDAVYTDPPYYDAIPYAHLSDWLFVWVKRLDRAPWKSGSDGLVPKCMEIAVDRPHTKSPSNHDSSYFAREIKAAFSRIRKLLKSTGIGIVVFAHLKTSAWEALLEALWHSGFTVTASWPIETERGGRLQAQGTASLQSSVHLVVRPRDLDSAPTADSVGDWRDVLDDLPRTVNRWLPRLAKEGIVGADAIFACIGPALTSFTRYSRVERSNGDEVSLAQYLEHVWAAISKEALSVIFRDADTASLEPDARLTAMWLWTLSSSKSIHPAAPLESLEPESESEVDEPRPTLPRSSGLTLEFDAARKIAQGLGIDLEKAESIVKIDGDKAVLLSVAERASYLFASKSGGRESARQTRLFNAPRQSVLFEELEQLDERGVEWHSSAGTVLDRVHQAMLLFAAGRADALRRFLLADGVGQDQRLWKLAQALSALYPTADEKRWIDGVLSRKQGLGL
jgi:putative DNA methylase